MFVHDSNWNDKKAVTNWKQSEIGMSLVEFWKWITGDESEGLIGTIIAIACIIQSAMHILYSQIID